jgi:hypothetical protein
MFIASTAAETTAYGKIKRDYKADVEAGLPAIIAKEPETTPEPEKT